VKCSYKKGRYIILEKTERSSLCFFDCRWNWLKTEVKTEKNNMEILREIDPEND
jgi:hypothetical protein